MFLFSRPKSQFERAVLPHLPAAYNLARWLLGVDAEAEDAVQEACLRAFQSFGQFRGSEARAWLLTITRNSAYSILRRQRGRESGLSLDDLYDEPVFSGIGPEDAAIGADEIERLREAIAQLPSEFREVIVLRDMEEFSYNEIAGITGLPIGTIMSRLSRARKRLRACVAVDAVESRP